MGNPAQPIALIKAKGNKARMSKKEIAEREARELKVPYTDVHPPEYFSDKQKADFNYYAEMLLALNVFTELDVDSLARYILERELYLVQYKDLVKARKSRDSAAMKEADIAFDKISKRIRAHAADLGLTPCSRARLAIPAPPAEDDEL